MTASITRRTALRMAGLAGLTSILAACGGAGGAQNAGETKVIKVGTRADSMDKLAAVTPDIEAAGYKIEGVSFDDSVLPNQALGEVSIDCNWYQHEPYLEAYNKSNGTDFVMVEPKSYAPLFGMYSSKWKSLDELPDGATLGMCSDASNQARGMTMLQDQGLLTLADGVETPTIHDVKDNPRNLQFIEAEMQLLPQSIDDVDGICLAAAHMVNAGKDANSYIARSQDEEEYAVGFVVRKEDADAAWATGLAKAVQCDHLRDYLANEMKGSMVPTWS
ncbi:MetQ/NlpA family ABC transporter substrate-binding protein [Olsenella profusa]|nr:MetQ/NlpA family ABC transporter substrate-binding protein [Olsenella profusa]